MKNIAVLTLMAALCGMIRQGQSQTLNWEHLDQKEVHLLRLNAGWDYGVVLGLGYGYQLRAKIPTLLTVSGSVPFGERRTDDFSTKAGVQMRLYRLRRFQFSAGSNAVYRRYENPLVRLKNLGVELTGVAGYYQSKWYVAGEIGFDRPIVTHFKHSESFRENTYQQVGDGWSQPGGGHFLYGLQAGCSFGAHDLVLKAGKAVAQDFKTTPLVPFYAQLVYQIRIRP